MWELTRDITCIAAWHGPEDEPWTVTALKDVQEDMVLGENFLKTYPYLPCYEKKIYRYIKPHPKYPSDPKPLIKRMTLVPQWCHCVDNLARIELIIEKKKYFDLIKDELSSLIEDDDIEKVNITCFPKLPLEKYRKAKERKQYWVIIRMPKPYFYESNKRAPIVDDRRTKSAMFLVLSMINRLQGLDHYKEEGSEEIKPFYKELKETYKFDRVDSPREITQIVNQNLRFDPRKP